MKITCGTCSAKFKVADSKIPDKGVVIKCPKCGSPIQVEKEAPSEAPQDQTLDPMDLPPAPDFGEDFPPSGDVDPFGAAIQAPPDDDQDIDGSPSGTLADTQFSFDDLGLDEELTHSVEDDLFDTISPDSIPAAPDISLGDTQAPEASRSADGVGRLGATKYELETGSGQEDTSTLTRFDPLPAETQFGEDSTDFGEIDYDGSDHATQAVSDPQTQIESSEGSQTFNEMDIDLPAPPEEGGLTQFVSPDQLTGMGDEDTDFGPGTEMTDFGERANDFTDFGDRTNFGDVDQLGDELLDHLTDFDTKKTYSIKRPNGDVVGPFTEDAVLDMLVRGKLSGEELAGSEDDWTPIVEIPAFSDAAIQARAQTDSTEAVIPQESESLFKERERIQDEAKRRRRAGSLDVVTGTREGKRLFSGKILVALPVIAVLALAVVYFMFIEERSLIDILTGHDPMEDPYKVRLSDNSPALVSRYSEFLSLMYTDDFPSLTKAREKTLETLQAESPFWGEELFHAMLHLANTKIIRRYGGGVQLQQEVQKSDEILRAAQLIKDDPEFHLAFGSWSLWKRQYNIAKKEFTEALSLFGNPNHERTLHLLAETHIYLPDKEQGYQHLNKLIESDKANARTYILYGMLYVSEKRYEEAREQFEKALEINPENLDAQIELAATTMYLPQGEKKATEELNDIKTKNPDRLARRQLGNIHYYLSMVYQRLDQLYKQQKELLAAIEQEPDNHAYRLKLGYFHLNKHEYDKAEEQFEQCKLKAPKVAACHVGLGEVFLATNRPDQALFIMDNVVKWAGNDSEVHFLLGKAYEGIYKPKLALQEFNKAMQLDGNQVRYFTHTAMMHLKDGNQVEAGNMIQRALMKDPNSPWVYNALGEMQLYQKDNTTAIDSFRGAIKANPKFVPALYNLANLYRDQGLYKQAIEQYDQVLALDEKSDRAHYGLATTYLKQGQLDKAISEFERALSLNRRNADYYFNAGLAYYQNGERDEAQKHFDKAIELSPTHAGAMFWRGRVYADLLKFDKAVESYEAAILLDKENPRIYYHLGMVFEQQDKPGDAIDQFDAALKLKPDFPDVYVRLGLVYMSQNRVIQAIKMFKKARELKKDDVVATLGMGDCYVSLQRYDSAIKLFKEAIALNPNNAQAHFKLGDTYAQQLKFKAALPHLKRAFNLDPLDPQTNRQLGFVYKGLDQKALAIRHFQNYLGLEEENNEQEDIEEIILRMRKNL